MNSYIVEPGARADTPPGMLQVSKMTSRFAPRDHPRVAVTPVDALKDGDRRVPEIVPPIYLIRGASRTPTGPPALVMAPSSL